MPLQRLYWKTCAKHRNLICCAPAVYTPAYLRYSLTDITAVADNEDKAHLEETIHKLPEEKNRPYPICPTKS